MPLCIGHSYPHFIPIFINIVLITGNNCFIFFIIIYYCYMLLIVTFILFAFKSDFTGARKIFFEEEYNGNSNSNRIKI
jgi:hypothetical protein